MVVLLDGGFGGEMDRRLRLGQNADPSWCARYHQLHPTLCREVHRDFADAGAQLVTANTYSILRHLLGCTEAEVFESVRAAVRLAREACRGRACLVAGSVSTHGFRESAPEETLRSVATLVAALDAADVDCVLVEMIQHRALGRDLIRLAARGAKPILLGFSLARDARGRLVLRGDPAVVFDERVAADMLACAAGATVRAAGVMHSHISCVEEGLAVLGRAFGGPLMAYPDNGVYADGVWRADDAAEADVADRMAALAGRQRRLLFAGGCCGLGPRYVRALGARLGRHPHATLTPSDRAPPTS